MKITKTSDVLKGTDVLEGTINREDEWIILAPRSPWCLKEQYHEDFTVLDQFCAEIITLRL